MPAVFPMIATADLPRLHSFYRAVLGAVEISRFPADGPAFFVELRIGESALGLVADDGLERADAPQRMLIVALVDDVDSLLPVVAAHGGLAPDPAHDMPWGQRIAHVTDPDGNTINLTQNR